MGKVKSLRTYVRSKKCKSSLLINHRPYPILERGAKGLVRRSSRTAQSPLGSAHPLRLRCSPALHRRICLITSRRVVPDCMTLPLFSSYLLVESISRRQRLMALASTPKQTRQEVTAAARELSSRQTVSTTSHAVSTRMHNRGAGR